MFFNAHRVAKRLKKHCSSNLMWPSVNSDTGLFISTLCCHSTLVHSEKVQNDKLYSKFSLKSALSDLIPKLCWCFIISHLTGFQCNLHSTTLMTSFSGTISALFILHSNLLTLIVLAPMYMCYSFD